MTYSIQVDIAGDCPLGTFLDELSQSSGKMTDFIAIGPGGGNPCVTLEFPDRELASKWFEVYGSGGGAGLTLDDFKV